MRGGRATNISSAGVGGTGTGTNLITTFSDPNSHLNRGFNNGINSLPVWGGTIAFNANTNWDFSDDASGGGIDFYSIALHEIGHALGLSSYQPSYPDDTYSDIAAEISGSSYSGSFALNAYNSDNGTNRASLDLEANIITIGRTAHTILSSSP